MGNLGPGKCANDMGVHVIAVRTGDSSQEDDGFVFNLDSGS